MKYIKVIAAVLFIIMILLWLLNPSYKDFKEFAAEAENSTKEVSYKRLNNYFLYSIYEVTIISYPDEDSRRDYPHIFKTTRLKYKAYLGNFYKVD